MLHLCHETPAAWAVVALQDPSALLLDHKFCEAKAAAMARAFIKRYGSRYRALVPIMKDLAQEEDEHREQCARLLKERGAALGSHHGNPYVTLLRGQVHSQKGGRVMDQLLIASIIEARSAERFRLLAEALRGETLGRFYEDLFASEARHHATFVTLAAELFGEEPALDRLREIAAIEGRIVAARPWGSFLH